jgi:hypothetical protein
VLREEEDDGGGAGWTKVGGRWWLLELLCLAHREFLIIPNKS